MKREAAIPRLDGPVANLCNSFHTAAAVAHYPTDYHIDNSHKFDVAALGVRAKPENEMNCRRANQTAPDRPWAVCLSVLRRGRIDLRAVRLRGRGRFTVSNPDGVELQRLVVSIE